MALNREKLGTVYPTYTYEIAREKIREYATALGETDPRFFSGGADCVAPPTFAACFTVPKGGDAALADPDLGTHDAMVHGVQRYVFGNRAIRPGDVVVCTPRIADISTRGMNEFLVVEVDCRFEDSDERAVLSAATMVFLGSAPERRDRTDGAPDSADPGAAA